MKRGLTALFTLLSAFALFAVPAFAQTQIVLNGSSGSMTFVSGGSNQPIAVCPSGCTMTGTATFEINGVTIVPTGSETADYTINFTSGTGTLNSSNSGATFAYTAGTQTATFSYTDSAGDSLAGDLTLTLAKDDTAQPNFIGIVTNVSTSGTSTFTNIFQNGLSLHIDWTLSNLDPTLSTLFNSSVSGDSSLSPISSGEAFPVPEPTSMLLLGTGLIALGFLYRKKKLNQVC